MEQLRLYEDDFYDREPTDPIKVEAFVRIVSSVPNQFSKAHVTDAGFDIRAASGPVIMPGTKGLVNTDLYMQIPYGYVGIIKSRSGLSVKADLEHGAGVIDSGYRGEVKVVLRNFGTHPYYVQPGDRIAQMLILKLPEVAVVRTDKLGSSDRGTGGFGHTGTK
jgi:dUTP pyrophosphatase